MMVFQDKTVGQILTLQRGYDITKKEQSLGDIPIVSSSGISSYHNEYKSEGPGVVIGRKGTLGTVHYLKENFWPHDTTLWVKDFKGNDSRFISYFLKTMKLELFDTGASNPTLNRNHVHKIRVLFPTIKVQSKISAILTAYDDLIENNKRRIAILEKMAEEIYREWFVRFRFPGYQTAEFEKGIPKKWNEKLISEFVAFKSGFSFKSETYEVDARYGVVTIKNVHDGKFISECSDYIAEPPSKLPKHCFIKNGDILMSLTGNVGRVCIAAGNDLLLNQRVALLKPCNMNYSHYIYWLFRQKSMLTYCEMISTGAAQQNLSPIKLGEQKLFFPLDDLIQKFQFLVEPIMSQVSNLIISNEKLTNTRNKLLPRLIAGKLSVENLDIQFPPSMQNEINNKDVA